MGRIRKIYDAVTQLEPTGFFEIFGTSRKALEARPDGVLGHREQAENRWECIGPDEEVTHDYACLFYAFYMFYIV